MKDIFLAILSIVSSVFLIVLLIVIGWYIVWKLFLSRFKFVRELLGAVSDNSATSDVKKPKVKKPRRD